MSKLKPSIYVVCWESHKAPSLHGLWIDATRGVKHIEDKVKEMLKSSPMPGAEEWVILNSHDFGDLKNYERTDFNAIADMAKLIKRYGELSIEVLAHFGGNCKYAQKVLGAVYFCVPPLLVKHFRESWKMG